MVWLSAGKTKVALNSLIKSHSLKYTQNNPVMEPEGTAQAAPEVCRQVKEPYYITLTADFQLRNVNIVGLSILLSDAIKYTVLEEKSVSGNSYCTLSDTLFFSLPLECRFGHKRLPNAVNVHVNSWC